MLEFEGRKIPTELREIVNPQRTILLVWDMQNDQAGGAVTVESQIGKGSTFTMSLPLTLAVAQAVLVRAGGRMWAIPAPMVEQVQQIKPDVLRTLYADGQVHWQGRASPFHYLPRLLGDAESLPDIARYNAVLLIRSGQGTAAIHVDEMVGNQEIVVKNIGPQLARLPGLRLVGDSRGHDFTPSDCVGHGSHVAGVIGATGWELPPGVARRARHRGAPRCRRRCPSARASARRSR